MSESRSLESPAGLSARRGTGRWVAWPQPVPPLLALALVLGAAAIGGACSAESNLLRYGVKDTPNCRDNFLRGLAEFDALFNTNR